MMEYKTVGREHPDWEVMMVHQAGNELETEGWNKHPRFRIILVEEGTGIVVWGNRRQVLISPMLFCINELETFHIEKGEHLKIRSIHFHPNVVHTDYTFTNIRGGAELPRSAWQDLAWLAPFYQRDEAIRASLTIGPTTARQVIRLMEQIDTILNEQCGAWPCRSRSYFLELLFLLERLMNKAEPPANELTGYDDIDEIILYLHQNYTRQVTLAELTRVFHMNRTTLIQRFQQATGETIRAYLINMRVRVAALILRDTMLPVAEVAERVGFKDLTHFGRTFKQQLTMTPSEYRRQYCWMLRWYPDYRE